ncbi:aldolase/citrate lyase family protein [Marinifilum caeruleilacunae]|uniref:Citrate lyase ACP n=1 Tax=Marinifilum caeruleilacunae TaxID=2499076 RepID=A0ABX1WZX7_9BACT|nr:aldolase/citrate lyase family protein [Marinifilum caeruleilacunae]NOU61725.1 citrate lyase ACP [Marinifilum caeruleilacunae]
MEEKVKIGIAGNFDSKLRGDCKIQIELTKSGGICIDLNSKVKAFFQNSICQLVQDMLHFYAIKNAKIQIQDLGALHYVIAARMEAAISQLIDSNREYLLPQIKSNCDRAVRNRNRFSRLYLPGNTPYMMINAGLHQANGIILDLEDSVAPAKKHEARYIVRNALRSQNFYGSERMVRINQGDMGIQDLHFVVPHHVQLILIPKVEDKRVIIRVEEEISRIRKAHKIQSEILLMPIIESALGIENAFEITSASKNIVAMAIGLEDYTADIGVKRSEGGKESLYARMKVVNACHAARIQAIDSVFSDVANVKALQENVKASKALGFQGMGCIHPRQIKVIHENYAPDLQEIEKAKKIVNAYYLAKEKGLGVVSLGSKMIDAPVVKRQLKTLELAKELGLVSENWRETDES